MLKSQYTYFPISVSYWLTLKITTEITLATSPSPQKPLEMLFDKPHTTR